MTLPLVLVPGLMCDARLYAPQIARFSRDRAVHFAPISSQSDVASMARAVLDQAPPHFALAGLSMGGIVAMEMLHYAPERIGALALLDTNPLAENEAIAEMRARQIAAARDGNLARVMRKDLMPYYLAHGPDKDGILDLCLEMAIGLGADVFERQSLALRDRPDQRDRLRSYGGPTLILCGAEDRLCPLKRHILMHDLIPQSVLTVVDGAGHLPTLEKPAETNAALATWLDAAHKERSPLA